MRIFPIALLPLVFAGMTSRVATAPPGSELCVVHGRIEILNPKVKLAGGRPDASGVVVWLIPLKPVPQPDVPHVQKRSLAQQNKRFIPHVMAIQVGAEVNFPNHDPFFHNVFSLFDGKPFDLGLYANGESKPVRFNRPGVSFIYCNIHPQMSAVIVTVSTPYFTVSTADGGYSIKEAPRGAYELHFWHERSDERQLAARSRVISVESAVADLGVIQLDESGYIPRAHKNKYGEEYGADRDQPAYRHP
jgi:plastocyanin